MCLSGSCAEAITVTQPFERMEKCSQTNEAILSFLRNCSRFVKFERPNADHNAIIMWLKKTVTRKMARNGSYVSAIIMPSIASEMQTVFFSALQPTYNKFFRRQRQQIEKKREREKKH